MVDNLKEPLDARTIQAYEREGERLGEVCSTVVIVVRGGSGDEGDSDDDGSGT